MRPDDDPDLYKIEQAERDERRREERLTKARAELCQEAVELCKSALVEFEALDSPRVVIGILVRRLHESVAKAKALEGRTPC